jgi:hypothetical protein
MAGDIMKRSRFNFNIKKTVQLFLVVMAMASVWAGATSAESISPLELIGQRPKPFIEPDGFYRVVIPSGFDCKSQKLHLECNGNRTHKAFLSIDVRTVPESATTELVMLNQMERFKKKRHFKLVKREKTKVADSSAIMATFTYDYLGNVEYPVGVQALYMVQKNKLYVIHFESQLKFFPAYEKDLVTLYESFYPSRLDAAGNPLFEDLELKGKSRTPSHIKNPAPIGY